VIDFPACPANWQLWRSNHGGPPADYFKCHEKDEGRRCDLEAGMAKPAGCPRRMGLRDNGAAEFTAANGFGAWEYKNQPHPVRRAHF